MTDTAATTHPSAAADPGTVTFEGFALDCADPQAIAHFYAGLLGGTVVGQAGDDWFTVKWAGPNIDTQFAPNHESPDWPRGQQQAHIDFAVADIASAHERVLALGGTPLDPVEPPAPAPTRGFRVYADPAGHPFCLCRPTPDA